MKTGSESEMGMTRRHRILVVDDDRFVRTVVVDGLRDDGQYSIDLAENADRALNLLDMNDYDLVVSDIVMPGMSGIDLIRKIRERLPDLQIILITGNADLSSAMEAVKLGVHDYMLKPIVTEELRWRVKKALEKSRLSRIENEYKATLEKKVREQGDRIRYMFFEAVESLIYAIEAKDSYTMGHSNRVAKYATLLAKHAGLSFDEASKVQLAARLHDIGKLGISDSVLNKPSKLTAEEFEIIKDHPVRSCRILEPILDLDTLAFIRHHHERWDGTGYPDGLREEEIPLGARIICLADSFDAITTERAYKDKMDFEHGYSELKRSVQVQFDPELVPVFADAMRKEGAQLLHL